MNPKKQHTLKKNSEIGGFVFSFLVGNSCASISYEIFSHDFNTEI